jgi:hypothetical protein
MQSSKWRNKNTIIKLRLDSSQPVIHPSAEGKSTWLSSLHDDMYIPIDSYRREAKSFEISTR